jgi:lysozyme
MITCNVVVDLSHNNPGANFDQARTDGILGVIHKASQGSGFVDPAYAPRRKAAQKAGLLWGAYHFGTAADPAAQAQAFLKAATPTPKDLVVLDFELNPASPGNSMNLAQARTFIGIVREATGVAPGLYGGSTLRERLGTDIDPVLGACWLWWAQYGNAPAIPPNWPTWTLWQYTDGHHGNGPFAVAGIGPCDRDKYQGSPEALRARWLSGTLA